MSPRFSLLADQGLFDSIDGAVLALRPQPDPFWATLPNVQAVQGFRPAHDALASAGVTVSARAPDVPFAAAIISITRSKEETQALIYQATHAVPAGGMILVDGSKTDGIESHQKLLKKAGLPLETLSKAHGRSLWWENDPGAVDAWADQGAARGFDKGYVSAAGQFGHGKIDEGSALLANQITDKLAGKVADLGAGWGYLAERALATNPKIDALTLFEAEATALDLARKNVTDPRAVFDWADVTALNAPRSFDAVIMNPPFHQGRTADPRLGQRFIQKASQILHPKGKLWMVANRQLAYEATLDACFQTWESLGETGRFKLVTARGPNGGRRG